MPVAFLKTMGLGDAVALDKHRATGPMIAAADGQNLPICRGFAP